MFAFIGLPMFAFMLVDVCYRGPSLFCRLRASMGLKHRDLVRSSFRLFHGQREHGLGASFAGFGMPQPSRSPYTLK